MNKNKTSQPEPGMATTTSEADTGNVSPIRARDGIANAWDVINNENSEAAANAHQLKSQTRQKLAEVADLASQSNTDLKALETASGEVGFLIYQGRTSGTLSEEEMNGMLGDTFGFKVKGDAKSTVPAGHTEASKTPAGQGEAIRKRVVRAVDAATFVRSEGETATRFFEDFEVSDIAPVVQALESGDKSLFAIYHDLQAMRAAGSTGRLPALHDPRQIAKLSALAVSPETIALAVKSPACRAALAELYRSLGVAGQAVAESMAEAA